jgi:hypothetical protein
VWPLLTLGKRRRETGNRGKKETGMCDIVKTDALLAFILKQGSSITFEGLRELRDRIEKDHPEVIVDISGPSVALALHYYPKLFRQEGPCIKRAEASKDFFESDYVDSTFLMTLSESAVNSLREAVSP